MYINPENKSKRNKQSAKTKGIVLLVFKKHHFLFIIFFSFSTQHLGQFPFDRWVNIQTLCHLMPRLRLHLHSPAKTVIIVCCYLHIIIAQKTLTKSIMKTKKKQINKEKINERHLRGWLHFVSIGTQHNVLYLKKETINNQCQHNVVFIWIA